MMFALTKDPPVGWLVVRWDFPQKFHLERKGEVSEDFYSHETILVLVAAMNWKTVDGKVENHAHFFVTPGYMKKNPAYIFHCMAIVMKWAAGRGGVTKVVHSSDRCRAEFSNGTFLLMLAKHFDEHQLDAEHVYSMEHEGKGPNDALGGVIRTLLKTAQKAGLMLRTPFDVCQALQSTTQGRPIKGKYSVFTQYVFHCVNPGDVELVAPGKTVPGITKSYSCVGGCPAFAASVSREIGMHAKMPKFLGRGTLVKFAKSHPMHPKTPNVLPKHPICRTCRTIRVSH